jgi:hypothetical protein
VVAPGKPQVPRLRRFCSLSARNDKVVREASVAARLEAAPFPFVLHAGSVVAQTNSGFLAASLLGMTNLLDGFAAEEIDQLDD